MRIAITGGIAAGKSTVSKELAKKLQFCYYNVDSLVQDVYNELEKDSANENIKKLRVELIKQYGTCNKSELLKMLNSDMLENLQQLFSVVMKDKLVYLLDPDADNNVIVEFPLLFETGYDNLFDFIVNVEAPIESRINRAMQRVGMSVDKLTLIMSKQKECTEKRQLFSHYTFVNDTLEALEFHTNVISVRAITKNRKVGIVSGSFDPITNGHLHLVIEGLKLMDFIVIAIAQNSNKQSMFSLDERLLLTKEAVRESIVNNFDDVDVINRTRVIIMPLNETLIRVSDMLNSKYIIRGLRNSTDFEYERQIDLVQRRISPWIETLYMMTPRELTEVSSSLVKSLHGLNGWEKIAEPYIPKCVLSAMATKLGE